MFKRLNHWWENPQESDFFFVRIRRAAQLTRQLREKEWEKNRTKFIPGWRLLIHMDAGRSMKSYDHPELQNLWKIYGWYLTRDSEKYNVESKQGFEIIHRHNVVSMELKKIKLPEREWVEQENNDETETD